MYVLRDTLIRNDKNIHKMIFEKFVRNSFGGLGITLYSVQVSTLINDERVSKV